LFELLIKKRLKFLIVNNTFSDFVAETQETQLGKYKFKITQNPTEITFGISTSEEDGGLDIGIKWDKVEKRLTLGCEGNSEDENFNMGVTLDKLKRQLTLDYEGKDGSGKFTGSGKMSMSLPTGSQLDLEGMGTFPIISKEYEKNTEDVVPLIPETPPTSKEITRILKGYSKTAKYILKLQKIMHSDGLIEEVDINKIFETPGERRGAKQALTRLSTSEKIKPIPVEKIGKDYRVLDPSIFSQILTAVGLKEERVETEEIISTRKFNSDELKPYINFSRSAVYASKLGELVDSDDLIRNSYIDDSFEDLDDRRRMKQTLIRLSKKEQRPVEKIGEKDYRVLDKDIFFKIIAAAELAKEMGIKSMIKETPLTFTVAEKSYILRLQQLIKSSTDNTVNSKDINATFKTREERIGFRYLLAKLEKRKEKGVYKVLKRFPKKYSEVTGFQFIKPEVIMDIKVSPEEVTGYKPKPLGGRKYIKHALALREEAHGEPPRMSENVFDEFFEERFGSNKGSMTVGKMLRNRLLEENYIRKTDHTYILAEEKFSELSEFL